MLKKSVKKDINASLKKATKDTSKREYHKTKHAPHILSLLDPFKVRKASQHCDRLFTTLTEKIGIKS